MEKLMIVDDSNIIRNKIARAVDKGQFEVVGRATNGEEAVSLCQKTMPSLVTMDITMPHMDGLDCIKELVKIHPEVKILVVSALSDKLTGIEALENGASGFLCKPFTDEDLTEALEKVQKTKIKRK